MRVVFECWFCAKKTFHEFPTPEGWISDSGEYGDVVQSLCPNHAGVEEFRKNQCPGCIGGFGSCSMWETFMYSVKTITHGDIITLETGVCPRRVMRTSSNFGPIDFAERTVEGGKAMAVAIRDYLKAYTE